MVGGGEMSLNLRWNELEQGEGEEERVRVANHILHSFLEGI